MDKPCSDEAQGRSKAAQHNQRLAVRTGVKAGALYANHSQRLKVRTAKPTYGVGRMRIKTRVKTANMKLQPLH